MSVEASTAAKPGARTASVTLLVGLLVVSIFINYIDRSNLSVAAPIIEKELSFSPVQMGWLFSAFFWTYSTLQLVGFSGWLSDRFPVGKVFTAGFALWSAATLGTGFLSGFTALFVMRLLLGAGESLAYPCYSRILASDVPQEKRGRANALLDAGSKLGPALGTFLGGLFLSRFGWRIFFVGLGALSLLWLIPWHRCTSCSTEKAEKERPVLPPARRMLRLRSAWGAFAGHFFANYFWFFLLTWLPSYLVKERGFSMQHMASIGSLAYLLMAVATLCAGWISDRLIAKGVSTTKVRKRVVVSGLLCSTVILPVAYVQNPNTFVILLLLSCMSFGVYTSNHWAITQTLAGPLMAGRWTSVQNGIGNYSGIVASWLTGMLVQQTGSFRLAFCIAAGFAVVAAAMWGLVVGPVREVSWEEASHAA